jgi:hypothetical protein
MQECVCTYQHIADLYNGMVDNPDNQWCHGNVRSTTPPPEDDSCPGLNWNEIENYTMTNCNHTVANAFVEPNCTQFLACNHGSGQCLTTVISEIQGANTPVPHGGGGGGGGGSATTYVVAGSVAAVVGVSIVVGYILWDKRRKRGGAVVQRAGPRYAQITHARMDAASVYVENDANDENGYESDGEDL